METVKPDLSTVGGRLVAARTQKGFSQIAAAKGMGHESATQLNRWEHGDYVPGARNLRKLAELYGVSVEWIVNGTDINESVPRGARPVGTLPSDLVNIARAFEREMARLGASDEELDYLQSVLALPEGVSLTARAPAGADRERIFRIQLDALRNLVIAWIADRMVIASAKTHSSVAKIPVARGKAVAEQPTAGKRRRGKAG